MRRWQADTSAPDDEAIFLVREGCPASTFRDGPALGRDIVALTQEEQVAARTPQVSLGEILCTVSVLEKHCNCPVDVVN
ncbi:hypothetical protein FI667_g9287, partial [Globisporangium splendens]